MKAVDKRLEALREELEKLRVQLEGRDKDLKAKQDQVLRLQADFDNAKKRWLKEQAEFQESANARLIESLLSIFDDFERALALPSTGSGPSTSSGRAGDEAFRQGVQMIAKQMESFLQSYGVTPLEPIGQPFDPTRHEAVAHEETEEAAESTVVGVLRKGYMLNGRVLRPAVVKVAVKPKEV